MICTCDLLSTATLTSRTAVTFVNVRKIKPSKGSMVRDSLGADSRCLHRKMDSKFLSHNSLLSEGILPVSLKLTRLIPFEIANIQFTELITVNNFYLFIRKYLEHPSLQHLGIPVH